MVGWYHSHPGYGCWLSGIDVSTQMMNQQFQEPWLAVVVDPVRTQASGELRARAAALTRVALMKCDYTASLWEIEALLTLPDLRNDSNIPINDAIKRRIPMDERDTTSPLPALRPAGKVEIGAFRSYPENYKPPDERPSEYQTIPLSKIEDFGVHAKQYYPLDVSFFKSSTDAALLEALWNRYWVAQLSASPLVASRDFAAGQISDIAGAALGRGSGDLHCILTTVAVRLPCFSEHGGVVRVLLQLRYMWYYITH